MKTFNQIRTPNVVEETKSDLTEMQQRFVFDTNAKAAKGEKLAKKFNLETEGESQSGYHYLLVKGKFTDMTKWLKAMG